MIKAASMTSQDGDVSFFGEKAKKFTEGPNVPYFVIAHRNPQDKLPCLALQHHRNVAQVSQTLSPRDGLRRARRTGGCTEPHTEARTSHAERDTFMGAPLGIL